MAERVRPHRADGHGRSWALLAAHHQQFKDMLEGQGLPVVKAGELPPGRAWWWRSGRCTGMRWRCWVMAAGRGTVLMADCEPGPECQVAFGRMAAVRP